MQLAANRIPPQLAAQRLPVMRRYAWKPAHPPRPPPFRLLQAGGGLVRRVAPQSCRRLVGERYDDSPRRSPQALHTALLPRFGGKEVVEIGARRGDGVARRLV